MRKCKHMVIQEVDNFELVEYIMKEEAKKCHVDNIIVKNYK